PHMIGIACQHGLVERLRCRDATLPVERHGLVECLCGRARVLRYGREFWSRQFGISGQSMRPCPTAVGEGSIPYANWARHGGREHASGTRSRTSLVENLLPLRHRLPPVSPPSRINFPIAEDDP